MISKTALYLSKSLSGEQEKNGSFLGFTSSDKTYKKNIKKYESIFFSGLILSCLCDAQDSGNISSVKEKLSKFLLKQRSPHWSYNYWTRGSDESKSTPYPDDLDDTFCVLSALYKYDKDLIDGEVMAHAVSLLTAVESEEGGPYKTWLVPNDADQAWKDVDLAVNSNVGHFLSLQEVELPSLNLLVKSAIEKSAFASPYYVGSFPVIYFISRFYKGKKKAQIVSYLFDKQKKNGSWGNPLDTALAITSLINMDVKSSKLKRATDYLLTKREESLKPYPFVVELIKGKNKYFSGSPSLTAAICIQALSGYADLLKSSEKKSVKKDKQITLHKKIVDTAKKRFELLDTSLKKYSLEQLGSTLKTDKSHPIVLLPSMFASSLVAGKEKIKKSFLMNLGLANICGWMAYTIYDDFLDDEGEAKKLSVANVCLRELSQIYSNNPLYQQVMDLLDSANSWEVSHCRTSAEKLLTKRVSLPAYGDYSRLADRSLGHALGPVSILLQLGFSPKSKEVKSLMSFFRHYLISRQLNDDMHDWENDLKMGHINAVGSKILKNYYKNYLSDKKSRTMSKLQEIFWQEEVSSICDISNTHTGLARSQIEKLSHVFDPALLERMIDKIEASTNEVIDERKKTLEFIKTYS